MEKEKEVVLQIIKNIQEQQSYPQIEITNDSKIVTDLGFKSLDIAQLIAMLEIELGVDPFAEGAVLEEIKTVQDLYTVYQKGA